MGATFPQGVRVFGAQCPENEQVHRVLGLKAEVPLRDWGFFQKELGSYILL